MHLNPFLALIIPFLSLFLNRFRGGWLPTGHTQVARGGWSIGMGLFTFIATGNWLVSICSIPLWMIFEMISPIGLWMGLDKWWQFPLATACGVLNVVGVVLLFWYFGYGWYFILATSALKGVAYYVGDYLIKSNIQNFRTGPEASECVFGFIQGLGVALLSL